MGAWDVAEVKVVGRCYCGGTMVRQCIGTAPALAGRRVYLFETTCDLGGSGHVEASVAFNRYLTDLLVTRERAYIGGLRRAAQHCTEVGLVGFTRVLTAPEGNVEEHLACAADVLRALGTRRELAVGE